MAGKSAADGVFIYFIYAGRFTKRRLELFKLLSRAAYTGDMKSISPNSVFVGLRKFNKTFYGLGISAGLFYYFKAFLGHLDNRLDAEKRAGKMGEAVDSAAFFQKCKIVYRKIQPVIFGKLSGFGDYLFAGPVIELHLMAYSEYAAQKTACHIGVYYRDGSSLAALTSHMGVGICAGKTGGEIYRENRYALFGIL